MLRNLAQKRIVVVGAGSSGLALTAYLCKLGAKVVLSDKRQHHQIDGLDRLGALSVTLDLGGHSTETFTTADMIVVSPGVPLSVEAIAAAMEAGVPVIGEIELAFGTLEAPVVAITGTNGKSTTTTMIGEIFRAWGKKTFVGGNLGTPLIEAAEGDWQMVVAELSSFQLEAIEKFRPRYALLLNISEDHLDRYPDMAAYMAAKKRIFENQTADDVMVLNADDALVGQLAAGGEGRTVQFSLRRQLQEGMSLDGSQLLWRWQGSEERFSIAELQLRGSHNLENVMAALIPPLLEGCPPQVAWQAVTAFRGLPHRMQVIDTVDGVTYCNDSKATNVGSVVKSLEGIEAPVTLIAGGKDKGGDYAPLAEQVHAKVAHLLLIGQAAERMEQALGSQTHCERLDSLEQAVRRAAQLSEAGGMVLLSPGCSSFDMFSSFEERGDVFARAVRALGKGS